MEEKEPLTNNTTNDETTQPETNEQEVQNQADTATEATEAPAAELTDAEKLAQAEAEIAELKDKILRQAADFANFRKHSMATHTELILNGGKKVLESLLPILDDMERAEANLAKSEEVETLREGLSLIFQKLQRTLEQQGLKKMETKEAQFDTDFHEAVALFPTEDEQQKNHIIDCVQTGYMLNDKVLRHAKVVVGQ
ncbi:nucleotide exchange factor GrpE [Alloprevotella sp. oral taxon 473]|jgi:grpE|uniref:nucleotide exchange factor GrpE n=1 Tax=Alloprevotella sp. oral taxon 473 TaxID=712469 RepID=UPI00034D26D3|nr:nucleotide exchange factor GrpE [Alloprevotella sp. oral taxon 473]